MRFTAANVLALALLLGAWSWLLYGYIEDEISWSAALAVLAALAGLFGKEHVQRAFGWGREHSKHDRDLFEKFSQDLPMQPTIQLLKEHNFGDAFEKAEIEPLHHFAYYWAGVDHEFNNRSLERSRKKLHANAVALSQEFARATVPIADGSLLSVFPDYLRAAGPRPDHVIRDAEILNQQSEKFVTEYEKFVRKCRRKLKQ